MREIGRGAFLKCSSLTGIQLPSGLQTILRGAFMGCEKLERITIPKTVSHIGERVFAGCLALKEIEVAEGNTHYASNHGLLYDVKNNQLICCPFGMETIVIPRNISVKEDVFEFLVYRTLIVEDSRADKPMHLHPIMLDSGKDINAVLCGQYSEIENTRMKYQAAAYDAVNGLNPEAEKVINENYAAAIMELSGDMEMVEALLAVHPPDAETVDLLLAEATAGELSDLSLILMNYKEQHDRGQ